ncbi:hypothetical protein LCGC14_1105060 [marine sediment metagenome]|uniref:Uncharacterized protein n=1 Tax=marine sediment metagenome TaxID=412755 RepID=A0A0F9PRH2_9ZZZZ
MREGSKEKNTKFYIIIGILVVSLGIVALVAWNPLSTLFPDEEEETIILAASTFTLYSAVDGEDVSNFATMDIWVPKSDATFEDGYEDITALTKNFEREESGKDADDISIDLRDYDYIWAEVVGNSVWENTFYLFYGGVNQDYKRYAHHTSSAVPFNFYVKNTGAAITIPGHTTNGNFTGVLDVPIDSRTPADNHYGDAWVLSTTEFGELTQTQQEFYWDESNWCDQYPTYDPTLDTVNELVRDFETITNTFALKFVMNATINVTDGAATQINCTIARGYSIDTVISGANLYMVWYEGFNFDPDPYTFDFEMWFGADITVTTVYSGRVDVPASLSSITNFVVYNEIGLVAA